MTRGVFYETGVLKIFLKFIGRDLCRILALNKVPGLKLVALLKRNTETGFFL